MSSPVPAGNHPADSFDEQWKSDPYLSDRHRRLYGTAPGGDYFHRQNSMLALHSMSGKTGFAIAWDKELGTQKKAYALYDNAAAYYANLMTLPTELRAGYELIPANQPSAAYMQVEFTTNEPDTHHVRLSHVCGHYRHLILKELGVHAEIFVACNTHQEKGGRFRNSYQVVIPNVVFACNHDGVMKHFFTVTDAFDPIWFYTTAKGETKPIVNQGVYTPKMIMQTPLCSKKGTNAPLVRISGDPLLDIFDQAVSNDVDALVPFGISRPMGTPITVTMSPQDLPKPVIQKSAKARRAAAAGDDESAMEVVPPFPLEAVQQLLVTMGDDVSTVGKVTINANQENSYTVHCDQKKQPRKCLHCIGLVHENSNCRLTVTCEGKVWGVRYSCFSANCAQLHDLHIGNFSVQEAAAPIPAAPAQPAGIPPFTTWNSPFTRPADERYSSPLVRDLPLDKKFVAVCAPCGTGEQRPMAVPIEVF